MSQPTGNLFHNRVAGSNEDQRRSPRCGALCACHAAAWWPMLIKKGLKGKDQRLDSSKGKRAAHLQTAGMLMQPPSWQQLINNSSTHRLESSTNMRAVHLQTARPNKQWPCVKGT